MSENVDIKSAIDSCTNLKDLVQISNDLIGKGASRLEVNRLMSVRRRELLSKPAGDYTIMENQNVHRTISDTMRSWFDVDIKYMSIPTVEVSGIKVSI